MDKQVPLLLGFGRMEYLASRVIHWLFGRAGRHLFLTDNEEGKPPLLLRMITNSSNLPFMYVYVNYYFIFLFFNLMGAFLQTTSDFVAILRVVLDISLSCLVYAK